MARRRTQNIRDLRAQYDAAERRKEEETEGEGDEEELDEADEEVEATEGEAEGEDEEEEAEEEAPVKKKKKVVAKEPKPKRVRTPKQVRQRVVWGVFNNSNQRVATFEYPRRKEADEHAAKLQTDKKSTFFVQPVKEPIEEKKE